MVTNRFDVPYPLSAEQVDSFQKDGFLVLTDVLTPSDVEDLKGWAEEVRTWPNRPGEHMPYLEARADGTMGLCRTENYCNFHPPLNSLIRGKRLTGILSELMDEQAVLFKEKINFKEAGGSGGFDPHIDANAYNHAGAIKHQTILLAVDAMDMSNGCLEVIPGSHKEIVPLGPDGCIEPAWVEKREKDWVPVILPAGSLLLFGSYLAHRSGPNSSPNPRAGIYATYNGISEGDKHDSYYIHRRKLWPPTFERVPGEKYKEGALTFAYGSPMYGGKEIIAERVKNKEANVDILALNRKVKVDNLFALLEKQGQSDYIGENISQLEHSLQAAELARQSGADDETIVGALLHDIGQFIPHEDAKNMVHDTGSVGRLSHEKLGETYCRKFGFPEKVCQLVGAHVVAKRYLTATVPGYLKDLSPASQASLKYQGGPFNPQEVAEFEKDPLHKEKLALRQWDDAAKSIETKAPGLETFRGIVEGTLKVATGA